MADLPAETLTIPWPAIPPLGVPMTSGMIEDIYITFLGKPGIMSIEQRALLDLLSNVYRAMRQMEKPV